MSRDRTDRRRSKCPVKSSIRSLCPQSCTGRRSGGCQPTPLWEQADRCRREERLWVGGVLDLAEDGRDVPSTLGATMHVAVVFRRHRLARPRRPPHEHTVVSKSGFPWPLRFHGRELMSLAADLYASATPPPGPPVSADQAAGEGAPVSQAVGAGRDGRVGDFPAAQPCRCGSRQV
jgi:hypothetical protein